MTEVTDSLCPPDGTVGVYIIDEKKGQSLTLPCAIFTPFKSCYVIIEVIRDDLRNHIEKSVPCA